jgi:hypothetical protein
VRLRRKRDREQQPPGAVYSGLRQQVLGLTADQLADAVPAGAPILALLMETGYLEAVATLVAVADGTTSLYFSNGGGVIGAGEHAAVAEAGRRLLETRGEFLDRLSPITDPPVPAETQTQFVAVTPGGLRWELALEDDLGEGEHPLSPLFHAGQDVITQIRLAGG